MPASDARVIDTDALVIGAGPVGLFQAFQLGLLEIKTQLIDALPHPGGQCIELYPDKPIYDIPGLPHCTGRELSDRLCQQIAPFHVPMHLGQLISTLAPLPGGRFELHTHTGTQFNARAIFLAAGAGAFLQRQINLPGLDRFNGTQVFYGHTAPAPLAGLRVMVLGGDEAAITQAIALAQAPQPPEQVWLLHRRDHFQASPGALSQLVALRASGAVQFLAGQATGFTESAGRLRTLTLVGTDAQTQHLAIDALIGHLGLSPKLGPIAQWGLALERKQVPVDTEKFETTQRGLYAVGDINTYPGKRKLIVSGFHEATLAAYAAAEQLRPERPVHLQYTTTSPRLHELLGVKDKPTSMQNKP